MIQHPSPTDPDGRDGKGRFAAGNKLAKGNPHAKRVAALRSALLNAVTEEDMRQIVGKLIELAKGGDVHAIKELFNRTLGRPQEADLIERLERLEEVLAERAAR